VKTYTKEEKAGADLVLLASTQEGATSWRGERAQAFCFWFGAYGCTQVIVYAQHFDQAAELAAHWIYDNQRGRCVSDEELAQLYAEAYAGLSDDKDDDERVSRAQEQATEGLSYWDPDIYIPGHEWSGRECDRGDILIALKGNRDRGRIVIVE
jgi:hypothetical protein